MDLFEGIFFPFSLNKFTKQLKFCLVTTACVTTRPQKCSVNLPPQDHYPCCRHPLLHICIPAPPFMYRSKYPYGYLPSRPFNSCWDKLCRVLSNSSSFLEEGIPAYVSNSWPMLNPLHGAYSWLAWEPGVSATKLPDHPPRVQPKLGRRVLWYGFSYQIT